MAIAIKQIQKTRVLIIATCLLTRSHGVMANDFVAGHDLSPTTTSTNIETFSTESGVLLYPGAKTDTATQSRTETRTQTCSPYAYPKCDSDSATQSQTNQETETKTATNTRSSTSTNTGTDQSLEQLVIQLDDVGHSALNSGAEKIALGITALSNDSKGGSLQPQDALRMIGEGRQDVASGQEAIDKANKVRDSENKMGAVGAMQTAPHLAGFDPERAPESTLQALAAMEKDTNVTASALADAVNSGSPDAIYELAASATGGQVSSADIAAQIPVYSVSPPSAAPMPSTPRRSIAEEASLKSVPAKQGGHAAKVEIAKEKRADSSREEIAPLDADQFLASLKKSALGSLPLGNINDSLFFRVRAQYQRHSILFSGKRGSR